MTGISNPTGPAAGPVVNALSVDVEDYYHVSAFSGVVRRKDWGQYPPRVEDNTRRVLDLFAAAGTTATFFMLGCVAERHPRLVRDIVADGHELASHGYAHHRVWELSPASFISDIDRTRRLLEDIAGVPVLGYRAPSFSIDHETWWAYEALEAAGYRYSSSIHPIRHDHYGMPDAPRFPFRPAGIRMIEIPVGTVERSGRRWSCAGGGFFRILPYAWSSGGIRRVNGREDRPVTFYFHPWEIDTDQPRIAAAPVRSRLRHYTNLEYMETKLRRLFADFAWMRMVAVYGIDAADLAAIPSVPAVAT